MTSSPTECPAVPTCAMRYSGCTRRDRVIAWLSWGICVRELEGLQGSAEFLAGDSLSLADLLVAPHLEFFRGTPEADPLLRGTSLDEWLQRMSARPSMQATQADRLRQAA